MTAQAEDFYNREGDRPIPGVTPRPTHCSPEDFTDGIVYAVCAHWPRAKQHGQDHWAAMYDVLRGFTLDALKAALDLYLQENQVYPPNASQLLTLAAEAVRDHPSLRPRDPRRTKGELGWKGWKDDPRLAAWDPADFLAAHGSAGDRLSDLTREVAAIPGYSLGDAYGWMAEAIGAWNDGEQVLARPEPRDPGEATAPCCNGMSVAEANAAGRYTPGHESVAMRVGGRRLYPAPMSAGRLAENVLREAESGADPTRPI